ncbi:uncharacterized protein LOC106065768 isoform X2 [Biomphalaria glabrata]|uniref:Uncharacterized protein LOC106065768 isoform X2 n=1 Tax=Biomphalaria glabrata TaxID=6526 RepID=A0A9W2ZG42_BIOGL|nr:uncharacterized protein LOC106065768 isoform X2 [Biomphalaria glabrata]
MSRGRLKPNDYKCIQDNFIFLKKELEARHLIDFLFQHGVISLEEKEHIGIKENKDARNDLLLTLILNAGPGDAFNYFLLSLEDRYRHVLTKLKGHSYSVQQQFHQEKNVLLEKLGHSHSLLQQFQQEKNVLLNKLDNLTSQLQISQGEVEKLEHEKDQVCDSCKQKIEKKKAKLCVMATRTATEKALALHSYADYQVTKLIVIGGFWEKDAGGITQMFDYVYQHGYAGAWSWDLMSNGDSQRAAIAHIKDYTHKGQISIVLQ